MVNEGATSSGAFREYVRHVQVPALRSGGILIPDNLAARRAAEMLKLIQCAGQQHGH